MAIAKARITWGTSFANTLDFGFPLDNLVTYSQSRDGSKTTQAISGIEDAWTVGTDYYVEFDAKWIPLNTTTTPAATGWDGSTGVRAFLEWARDKNQFTFIPDIANLSNNYLLYLVEPMQGGVSLLPDGSRTFHLSARGTTPFAGV